jgi:hypothetical protein
MKHVSATVALALVVALTAGACSPDEGDPGSAPPSTGVGERTVFVLLGGDETVDPPGIGSLTRAWEQVVFSAMPPASVLVDLADREPTAKTVIREQLPRAQALRPTVATVWLGAGDAEDDTSVGSFADSLEQIVTGLQQAGARTVLLLSARGAGGQEAKLADNAPLPAGGADPGNDPSVTTTEPDGSSRYDGVIDEVAARTGAKVVVLRPDRLTQESLAGAVRPHVAP